MKPGWERAFSIAAWAMAFALVALFLWALVALQQRMAVYFGLFAITTLIANMRWRGEETIPGPPRALLAFGLTLNAFGWAFRWLDAIVLYDEAAHLITSAGLVAVLPAFTPSARVALRRQPGVMWLFLVGLGAIIGIVWEVYEWTADHFVVPPGLMSIHDTITDLIADLLGAMAGAVLGLWTARVKVDRSQASAAATRHDAG